MPVRREADARNNEAALAHRVLGVQLVIGAVQIVDAGRDHGPLEVLPRAVADAAARIDRGLAVSGLRAEIGPPGLAARAVARGERLAVLVGTLDAAEVGALSGPRASDKERHVRR